MNPLEYRISLIENQLAQDKAERQERQRDLDERLTLMQTGFESIIRELGKYKGFVGGVSLIVSILWAGLTFFKEQIIKALS